MTRMQHLLPAYKSLWEPAGSGSNAQRSDAYGDWYAEGIHSFLPGTWVISGHHRGHAEILKLFEAVRRVWTVRSVFHHNNYWLGEDTICTEWFSTNGVWTGQQCRNSGLTRHTFAGEHAIEWQEYTDSEFFEEMHAGWRDVVGPEIGAHISRGTASTGPPWYPDPARERMAPGDVAERTAVSCAPPAMRHRLEAAIEFWSCPAERLLSSCSADDVDVHFQGRSWPLGGHHRGRDGVERLFEVASRIWPASIGDREDRVLGQRRQRVDPLVHPQRDVEGPALPGQRLGGVALRRRSRLAMAQLRGHQLLCRGARRLARGRWTRAR